MGRQIRRCLLLPVVLSSLIGTRPIAAQEPEGVGRGTLGVLIITKQGMVLAADSRTTYGNGRHNDTAVKIFKLGSSGCMIAGTVVSPGVPTGIGFNLPQEIQSISGADSFMDSPLVYEGLLENRLSTAIQMGVFYTPQPEFFDDDQEIASVLIGGYQLI